MLIPRAIAKGFLYIAVGLFAAIALGELLLISHSLLEKSGLITLTFLPMN